MKTLAIAGIVVGALLMFAPVLGLFGTVVGMIQSFDEVAVEGSAGAPADLADGISTSLMSTVVGVVLCPVGIVLLVVSIVAMVRLSEKRSEREKLGK